MLRPRRLALSFAIVAVNAWPGIVIAWNEFDQTGIMLGVALWLGAYAWLGHTPSADRLLGLGYVRYALVTVILLRLVPFCWMLDIFCGAFSIHVFGFAGFNTPAAGHSPTQLFLSTLGTTLLHGLLMGLAFWAAVSALAFLYSLTWKGEKPSGLCAKCGYDLRASPVRCPECGTPNPNPSASPPLTSGAAE